MDKLQAQLWLTHQAAFEYQKNRIKTIVEQLDHYKAIDQKLGDFGNSLKELLDKRRRHSMLNPDELQSSFARTLDDLRRKIVDAKTNHPEDLNNDELRTKLDRYFEKSVGSPYDEKTHAEKIKEAMERLGKGIRPGVTDTKKGNERAAGDVIIWFQLIDKAKSDKKPTIFVTEENKDDWWQKIDKNIVGPHPQLVQEFAETTGQQVWFYQNDQFIEFATKHIEALSDKESSVEAATREVREVRQEVTERRAQMKDWEERMRALIPQLGQDHAILEAQKATLANKSIIKFLEYVKTQSHNADIEAVRAALRQVERDPSMVTMQALRQFLDRMRDEQRHNRNLGESDEASPGDTANDE